MINVWTRYHFGITLLFTISEVVAD